MVNTQNNVSNPTPILRGAPLSRSQEVPVAYQSEETDADFAPSNANDFEFSSRLRAVRRLALTGEVPAPSQAGERLHDDDLASHDERNPYSGHGAGFVRTGTQEPFNDLEAILQAEGFTPDEINTPNEHGQTLLDQARAVNRLEPDQSLEPGNILLIPSDVPAGASPILSLEQLESFADRYPPQPGSPLAQTVGAPEQSEPFVLPADDQDNPFPGQAATLVTVTPFGTPNGNVLSILRGQGYTPEQIRDLNLLEQIAQVNELEDVGHIQVGQELVIPTANVTPSLPGATPI
ncbi:MAG: LysM peptidoglycan-binding domain-containing protein [Vulcanimicrobiota bacterium]